MMSGGAKSMLLLPNGEEVFVGYVRPRGGGSVYWNDLEREELRNRYNRLTLSEAECELAMSLHLDNVEDTRCLALKQAKEEQRREDRLIMRILEEQKAARKQKRCAMVKEVAWTEGVDYIPPSPFLCCADDDSDDGAAAAADDDVAAAAEEPEEPVAAAAAEEPEEPVAEAIADDESVSAAAIADKAKAAAARDAIRKRDTLRRRNRKEEEAALLAFAMKDAQTERARLDAEEQTRKDIAASKLSSMMAEHTKSIELERERAIEAVVNMANIRLDTQYNDAHGRDNAFGALFMEAARLSNPGNFENDTMMFSGLYCVAGVGNDLNEAMMHLKKKTDALAQKKSSLVNKGMQDKKARCEAAIERRFGSVDRIKLVLASSVVTGGTPAYALRARSNATTKQPWCSSPAATIDRWYARLVERSVANDEAVLNEEVRRLMAGGGGKRR
jgi:hypothetical protein